MTRRSAVSVQASARPRFGRGVWRAVLLVCRLSAGLVMLAGSLPVRAADIQVQATVDRNQVTVGEQFTLTIAVTGAQNVPAPDLGDLAGFQAQYLGPATQVSIVNGRMSSSVSHRYTVQARRAGRLTLGPFQVRYGGVTYNTTPIVMQVGAQPRRRRGARRAAPVGRGELQLDVVAAKKEAYVGERISLTVRLYVGNARVQDLEFPKVEGDGFTLDSFPQPSQRDQIVNGRRFKVLDFQTVLTPLRAGALSVGPTTMGMTRLRNRRRRFGGGIFDDFGFGFGRREPVQVSAGILTLRIHPLPKAGRPRDFSGAVGQFDFSLSAKPTKVNAGDPVTVRMEISGTGSLATLTPPRVPVDNRFRTYDPSEVKDQAQPGRRVFEQVVIPKLSGATQLPPVRFSFFDPEAKAYRTEVRGPVPLTVNAAAQVSRPQLVLSGKIIEPRPAEHLGRDIVYVKDRPGEFRRVGSAFYLSPWFYLIELIPGALFLALIGTLRRREKLAADPRILRLRRAGPEVRKVLRRLGRGPSDGDGFYDELSAAVCGYLAAKLDLPPGAVEREAVLRRLSDNGVREDLHRPVRDFFELVERVRYASNTAPLEERKAALSLADEVVGCLERERGLRRFVAAWAMLLLCAALIGTAMAAVDGESDPHTAFFQGNAAYKQAQYPDAIRRYEGILAEGFESGPLYFNLGNAYFKNGRLGYAILNFERARDFLPRDPDVRANVAYARNLAKTESAGTPFWRWLAFSLADHTSTGELATVGSILWWVLWFVLAGRLLWPRPRLALSRVAWGVAVLLLIVAGNFSYRLDALELRDRAVVTAPGEVAVRYEPSETGTEYYRVKEGTMLEITGERAEWRQVRRSDGRRGWIASNAVTRMRRSPEP